MTLRLRDRNRSGVARGRSSGPAESFERMRVRRSAASKSSPPPWMPRSCVGASAVPHPVGQSSQGLDYPRLPDGRVASDSLCPSPFDAPRHRSRQRTFRPLATTGTGGSVARVRTGGISRGETGLIEFTGKLDVDLWHTKSTCVIPKNPELLPDSSRRPAVFTGSVIVLICHEADGAWAYHGRCFHQLFV